MYRNRVFRIPSLITGAVLLAGMTTSMAAAETVTVSLQDAAITIDHASAKEGVITFNVANLSSQQAHDLVIVTKPAGPMPYDAKTNEVIVKKVKAFGQVTDLAAGAKSSMKVKLQAGDYVLICNHPGHYKAGMHVDFTVEP